MNIKEISKYFLFVVIILSVVSCRDETPQKPVEKVEVKNLVFQKIPDRRFPEGTKSIKINLSDYLQTSGIDRSKLSWSFSKSEYFNINISESGIAELILKDSLRSGSETVLFEAGCNDSLFASASVRFYVVSINRAPKLHFPLRLSFREDEELYPVDLSFYINDDKDEFENLVFSFESENLSAEKNGKYLFVKTKEKNWNGTGELLITVTDRKGKSASERIIIIVQPVNDKPSFAEIPPVIISEKEKFPNLDLKKYLFDVDDSLTLFSYETFGGKKIRAEVDSNGIVKISRNEKDWTGKEVITFAATDEEGLTAYRDVEFIVQPVNDPPAIVKIPNQSIWDDERFQKINLNDFVFDSDDDKNSLKWKISGSQVTAEFIGNNIVLPTYPAEWRGGDTLIFIVQDKGGLCDTSFAVFTVEEKPLLKTEPYKTVVNIGLTAVEDVVLMASQPIRWKTDDWLTFGSVAGGTYLFTLIDEDIREIAKRNDHLIDSPLLEFGRFYGETNTTYYASGAFAAYGLILQDKTAFRIGLEIFESYFIANTITSWLKAGIGRSRPYLEEGPKEYNPFNAKNNSQKSLPSGHTTLAFSLSSGRFSSIVTKG